MTDLPTTPDSANRSADSAESFCKHTPGPWKIRKDYAGAMSVVSCDSFLARVGPPNTEQALGNAQLMAAAPDLLEALELMLKQFTKTPSTLKDTEVRGKAHAAIAKATRQSC